MAHHIVNVTGEATPFVGEGALDERPFDASSLFEDLQEHHDHAEGAEPYQHHTEAVIALTRTMIAVWIVGVWGLQLWWSTWWLDRFRYGPFEWAWRSVTYRSWQPLRRPRNLTP